MTEFRFLNGTDAVPLSHLPVNKLGLQGRAANPGTGSRAGGSADIAQILAQIADCEREHKALDAHISELAAQPAIDELQLRRLKKHKLHLKDRLCALQMLLVPDIPA